MSAEDGDVPGEAGTVTAAVAGATTGTSGWTAQDRRNMTITIAGGFAGGLAANLATVILVGLAIALVRSRPVHVFPRELIVTAVAAAFAVVMMTAAAKMLRPGQRRWARSLSPSAIRMLAVMGWLFLPTGTLLLLEVVLIWVGLASGVK